MAASLSRRELLKLGGAVASAGLGLTATCLSTTVMASVASDRLGLASGINSTLSRLSAVLAVACFGPIALICFGQSLATQVRPLNLSHQAQAELRLESARLAEAKVPAGLRAETAAAVRESIKRAFVGAFRIIAVLSAVLSGVSALLAARLLEDHPLPDHGPCADQAPGG